MIRHRTDTVYGNHRIKVDETIGDIESQRRETEEWLRELKRATRATWDDIEQQVEQSLLQLELAVEDFEDELD
jgi:hypothetical protein